MEEVRRNCDRRKRLVPSVVMADRVTAREQAPEGMASDAMAAEPIIPT